MKLPVHALLTIALITLPTASCQADGNTTDTDTNVETLFYQAIDRTDVDAVLDTLHPSARQQVDRPVLAAWVNAVDERHGPHRSIQRTASSRTLSLTGTRIETTSTVTFEKGVADATITVQDGRIIDFSVQSDEMKNWFQGLTDVAPYDAMAHAFISAFLANDSAKAPTLMHAALQKAISNNDFETMIDKITDNGGKLESLKLNEQRFSLDGPSPALFLSYLVQCEKAAGTCEVEFQFVGMKGFLLGFDFE